MRLWGIGLLALLLVGVLIALGQAGLFDGLTGRSHELVPQFSDYEAGSVKYYNQGKRNVFVAQAHPDAPQILSGLPSYLSKTYHLPVDSRPVSGMFKVFFRVDTAKGTEGALRVTINGVKRADVTLEVGRREQEVQIELTHSELSARLLDVRIALVGRGPLDECTPNEAIAAAATILPRSGLELKLDKPVESARDKLVLWGSLIPVKWEGNAVPPNLETVIASARLLERGQDVFFGSEGLTQGELRELLQATRDPALASLQRLRAIPKAYPISLLSDTANVGVRSFDRETAWRFTYDIAELPGGELPTALDLRMVMGPVEGTRTRMLVTLNDHFVTARAVTGENDRQRRGEIHINQSIKLAPELHKSRNQLAVILTSYSESEQRCGPQRLIAAEMLAPTVLLGGGHMQFPIAALRAALVADQPVRFSAPALTAPDARAATILLSQLHPNGMRFDVRGQRASIEVVTGDLPAGVARLKPPGRDDMRWIVSAPVDRRESVVAEPLTAAAEGLRDNVALIVTVAKPVPQAKPAAPAGTKPDKSASKSRSATR